MTSRLVRFAYAIVLSLASLPVAAQPAALPITTQLAGTGLPPDRVRDAIGRELAVPVTAAEPGTVAGPEHLVVAGS